MENSTLQRLKSKGRGEDTEGTFEPLVGEREKESNGATDDGKEDLIREDRDFLGGYITPGGSPPQPSDDAVPIRGLTTVAGTRLEPGLPPSANGDASVGSD